MVETGRGLTRESRTNDAGAFLFPTVSAGIYSLTVSKPAFETYQLKDVRVDVGQRATLDVVLQVGRGVECGLGVGRSARAARDRVQCASVPWSIPRASRACP